MNGATLLINLSASDEITGKAAYRESLVKNQSARCVAAYIYADCGEGESSTDLVFSGHNIIAENGKVIAKAERFSTGITYGEIDLDRISADRRRLTTFVPEKDDEYEIVDVYIDNTDDDITRKINNAPFVPADKGDRDERCNEILTIQAMGLKKRLDHTGCKCAVIGISGGLDSTLALLVTVKSFDMLGIDRKNIRRWRNQKNDLIET
jgi:NAD+ synthase (glutamine-hydrolysing)